jgi:hypothetical protein
VNFNLADGTAWTKWDENSEFALDGSGLLVWIICGGLNDKAQDGNTTFDNLTDNSNGNGAAAFRVKWRYWVAEGNSEERNAGYKGEGSELFIWVSPTFPNNKNRKSLYKPIGIEFSGTGNGLGKNSLILMDFSLRRLIYGTLMSRGC